MPRKIVILTYPITRYQLAQLYNLSLDSFGTWLKDINISHSHRLSPADVKRIIDAYGVPAGYKLEI